MIKIYTLALAVSLSAAAFAQSTDQGVKDIAAAAKEFKANTDTSKKWDIGGSVALNFGQTFLANWASGGQNAISVSFNGFAHANYRKGKWAWDNNLIMTLGGIALFPQQKYKDPMNAYPFRKNIDNFQITSTGGYELDKKKHWYVSLLMDFRTQLLNGYGNYRYDSTANGGHDPAGKINARDRVASFAAPAYLTLTAGITYKPKSWLSFYLAPVAGKFTFVRPGLGINATNYGLTTPTSTYRAEFGWYFRANIEKEIIKNVIIKSQVELFDNYLDNHHADVIASNPVYTPSASGFYDNRKNIDVNWQTWITFKINKYLQASLEWQLLYDYDIAVPKYNKGDATKSYQGRGVQFREGFNLGLGYMF